MKVNIFMLISLMVALNSHPVQAKEDPCVAEKPGAQFKSDQAGIRDYKIEISKDERKITETFKLEKVQSVSVEQGGCAHYGKSITFKDESIKWIGKKFDNAYWLETAKTYLKYLPEKNNVTSIMVTLIETHESTLKTMKPEVDGTVYKIQLTDSNGYNTIIIEVDKKSKGPILTVALDVSL